ncbi:hypothetical protein ACFL9U_05150 [Thermodesulfobacteriota bacterium]
MDFVAENDDSVIKQMDLKKLFEKQLNNGFGLFFVETSFLSKPFDIWLEGNPSVFPFFTLR